MNKRKKVAMHKHGRRERKLEARRKEALKVGAKHLSKGKMHRLASAPVPPVK
jgi:hypothetical protein